MPTTPELDTSVETLQTIATFFHEATHQIERKKLRHGADMVKIARKAGLKIPPVLEGHTIKYDARPHKKPGKGELARTIVLELPPRPATDATPRQFGGCYNTSGGPITGRVCVDCNISWFSLNCKITITIVVKV